MRFIIICSSILVTLTASVHEFWTSSIEILKSSTALASVDIKLTCKSDNFIFPSRGGRVSGNSFRWERGVAVFIGASFLGLASMVNKNSNVLAHSSRLVRNVGAGWVLPCLNNLCTTVDMILECSYCPSSAGGAWTTVPYSKHVISTQVIIIK